MKAWWKIQSGRIDALSLRERVFLFVTIIVCLLAIADTVWISPTQVAYRQTTVKLSTQNEELQRLRTELGGLYSSSGNAANDPSKILRDDMATAKERLQTLDKEISTLAKRAEGAPSIEEPLIQFLRRQDGLTLLGAGTLANATPLADQPTLSKRGLELRVSGSYADLSRYIHTLEQALPELRWGSLEIKIPEALVTSTASTTLPVLIAPKPELAVQVYVMGVTP